MNKRLDELRDAKREDDIERKLMPLFRASDMSATAKKVVKETASIGYNLGFNTCLAELMPRVKKIFDAAKYANEFVVISKPYMSCEIMKEDAIETEEKLKTALTEWREFMGEG